MQQPIGSIDLQYIVLYSKINMYQLLIINIYNWNTQSRNKLRHSTGKTNWIILKTRKNFKTRWHCGSWKVAKYSVNILTNLPPEFVFCHDYCEKLNSFLCTQAITRSVKSTFTLFSEYSLLNFNFCQDMNAIKGELTEIYVEILEVS